MSPIRPSRSITRQLSELQAACRACTRCVEDGIIERAAPCFEGGPEAVFFLVGQAPGPTEVVHQRPFMGRAGQILNRWMARAGFESDEEFRRFIYIAAMMRCFPGRSPKGSGDRPPPVPAVRNCSSWLEAELELLRPPVIVPVGQLAIRRFLGPGPLEERVGKTFGDRPLFVPLPHPSGQSRWLNQPANRERLEAALVRIGELRDRLLRG